MSTSHSRSRMFSTNCIASESSYHDHLAIDDALHLPPFHQYSRRYVATRYGRWELWSPNLSHSHFHLGMKDQNYSLEMARDRSDRRCDGHLGPFDFTFHPQVFDPIQLWCRYILRPSEGHRTIALYPEYTSLLDVWRDFPTPGVTLGSVRKETLGALELWIIELTQEMESRLDLQVFKPSL
jgi:hypothetical protein